MERDTGGGDSGASGPGGSGSGVSGPGVSGSGGSALGGALSVRAAVLADAPRLVDWNLRLALESEGLHLDVERLSLGVRAALADPARGRYFLVERAGEALGGLFVTLEWSDWRNGWWWWIQSVYVEPAARRQGVYDALHHHLEARARAAGGVVGLRLYVEQHNERAQRTYLRLGMGDSGYRLLEQPLEGNAGPA